MATRDDLGRLQQRIGTEAGTTNVPVDVRVPQDAEASGHRGVQDVEEVMDDELFDFQ